MSTGQSSASASYPARATRPAAAIQILLDWMVMPSFTTIDLDWTGRPKSIAALLLESGGTLAVVDPGPESTLETLRALLRERGHEISSLKYLLLTHIHLDHAGAVGALVRENPALKVYVHEF